MRPTEDIEKRIKNVKIVIDSESNKRVFSNILWAFQKSKAKELSPTGSNIWRIISKSPITKLAATAVIILAIGLFAVHRGQRDRFDSRIVSEVSKSPAEMLTAASLNIAYRQGGMEAVEKEYEKASEMRGAKPTEISLQELLAEFNGT